MLHKKLVEILPLLSRTEHQRWRLFLLSPFFVRSEFPLRLYDYMMNPEPAPEAMQKALAYRYVFSEAPTEKHWSGKIDLLSTELFGLLKSFLGLRAENPDERAQKDLLVLARMYRKHGLGERFDQTIESLRKFQYQETVKDANFYQRQFLIETEDLENHQLYKGPGNMPQLDASEQAVERSFFLQKLELLMAHAFQNKYVGVREKEDTFDSIVLRACETGLADELPLAKLYCLVLKICGQPDQEQDFLEFERLLEVCKNELPPDKRYSLMAFYRNFWQQRYYRPTDPVSSERFFQLFKSHFEQGFLNVDGGSLPPSFRLVITTALKCGHLDWAKKMLDQYGPEQLRGTKYATEIYRLFYAEYFFYAGDFEAALQHLAYRNFENQSFMLIAESLLIKVYFETGNELLGFRMKAFEQKVRRMRLSPDYKNLALNFLKCLRKIEKHGWSKNISPASKIKSFIAGTPAMMEREWLLDKLENGPVQRGIYS